MKKKVGLRSVEEQAEAVKLAKLKGQVGRIFCEVYDSLSPKARKRLAKMFRELLETV